MLSLIDTLLRVQAQRATFLWQNFIRAWFRWGKMCLLCHMRSISWLEIMIQHTPSIICDFHLPVDFRLNILFPHIFWFLHHNGVGICGFTLTKLRHVGDEEKTSPSWLDDTSSPMIASPVFPRSASGTQKKTYWPKLDRFKFFSLDTFEVLGKKPMGSFGIYYNILDRL